MNRSQRRNQSRPKSSARKAGLTYLTLASVVGGSIGLASPAHAAIFTSTDCSDLRSDLNLMQSQGGELTATFSGTCDILGSYSFQEETSIMGPTSSPLTLRFMDTSGGFQVDADFSVFNFVFTHELGSSIPNFIFGRSAAVEVTNVTFSNAEVESAIYAEGNLTVSNSTFENLTASDNGPAIYSTSNLEISNSTFKNNEANSMGGAIYSSDLMFISNSTFESNESGGMGGAVYSLEPDVKVINNSTFIGNSSGSAAAVFLSEGGVIANSTFWNNGDADTYSISDSGGIAFFGNILANDAPTVVKLTNPSETNEDLGANLYTDDSFDDNTSGIGSSQLVTPADLKLSPLALNLTGPENFGVTKTVAIASDSVAKDFYAADSTGINPTIGGELSLYTSGAISSLLADLDQRLVGRPIEAGYDVGAFELGATPEPSEEPEVTDQETLADTGLPTGAGYLGLVGLGAAAILGGSAGILRRRKKA